jgi:beta-glucanase (GH16 family)
MKTNRIIFMMVILLLTEGKLFAQNWQQVWADEFTNGISSDWVFETGAGGWGNNELQYYRRENASVENGQLVITAKREGFGGANYTSARMKTQGRKSWKYGKIEARIAMPSFQGVWPAFWMLGDNISSVGWPACGEIDIMEHVNTGGEVVGTIHWADLGGGHAEYGGRTSTNITAYHTYAVEWDGSSIKWFVDGNHYHTASIANGVNGTNELHNNFFILLNMAIGGNWPGFSIDNNAFPAKMYIDYVRVYQAGANPPPPSGNSVATAYKHCDFGGFGGGLPVGDYNYGALYAKGIANEDISSLRVNSGYQVQLFEHDDFTGASITFSGDDACLVDNGWNDRTTSLKVRAGSTSFSRTIQAEDYSAMLGVQKENTTDAGGGQNVGYIDNGDWMAYNAVNFPTSGTYTVEYRVASVGGGRVSLDLNAGAIQLGAVNVPATGGWQNWTTVSHTVNVNAGTYNVGLFAQTGGFNINWFRITKSGNAKTGQSEEELIDIASNYNLASAVEIFPNPIEGELKFVTGTDLSGASIKIVDAMGIEVKNTILTSDRLDVSSLSAGFYIMVVEKDGNIFNKRFIKR